MTNSPAELALREKTLLRAQSESSLAASQALARSGTYKSPETRYIEDRDNIRRMKAGGAAAVTVAENAVGWGI